MGRRKICDEDCLHCPHPDCINDKPPYHYAGWDWCNRSDEYKAKYKEYRRERCERLKAAGLCTNCAKRPLYSKTLCLECYLRNKKSAEARRKEKAAQTVTTTERRAREGKCCWCEEPRLPGRKVCQAHYEATCERYRQASKASALRRKERREQRAAEKV